MKGYSDKQELSLEQDPPELQQTRMTLIYTA